MCGVCSGAGGVGGGRAVINPDTTITTGTIQPHQSPKAAWMGMGGGGGV